MSSGCHDGLGCACAAVIFTCRILSGEEAAAIDQEGRTPA
jgi:hypothetical protein